MICDNCGFKNNRNKRQCVACGADLSAANLSKEEVSQIIDKLADKGDLLIPSKFEIVFKWICFALAPIMFVIYLIVSQSLLVAFVFSAFIVFAGFAAGCPNALWRIQKEFLKMRVRETDLTPPDIWGFGRKITYWGWLVLGIGLFMFFLITEINN